MDDKYSKEVESSFKDYLTSSKDSVFVLDLSKNTLIECINEMCKIKSHSHPKITTNYRLLVKKIEKLEALFGCTVYPSMISSVFWNHFIPFLVNQGLKYSTVAYLKSGIIAVLNWSSKYGVKLNPSYNEIDLPSYTSGKIALTPDEISHIYHFKLGAKKAYSFRLKKEVMFRKNKLETLDRVRDMFVLGCNLGQRYSDLVRISPDNFKKGQFSMVQQKTGNRCTMSINAMAIESKVVWEILEKYGHKAPYTGNINNFNTYLHELLLHIGEGFLEEIHIENKINGKIVRETKKKYQLISSHSARRSFATINSLRNIPRNKILRATGHSSEKAFNRYICYDED